MTSITINVDETAFASQLAQANKIATVKNDPAVTLDTLIESRVSALAGAAHQQTIREADPTTIARVAKVLGASDEVKADFAKQVDALPNV